MKIERVLVCPLNYSHRQTGQLQGFRDVFADNVREFDFMGMFRRGFDPNAPLVNAATEFEPDWIWLQLQGSNIIQPWTIDRIRRLLPTCFISHWMGDCRASIPKDLAEICRVTHATLISNVGQIPLYREAGARRAHYVQIGLDLEEDVYGLPPWEPPFRVPDVVFCGNHYASAQDFTRGTSERISAIRRLAKEGIDVGVVGTGWPSDIPVVGTCHVKQQHHVYKRAKVALSINHFNDIERYYSDRQLIAMASGTPVIARYVPGLEHEFIHGVDCYYWRIESDLVDMTQELLQKPWKAASIGAAGREKVTREHTWASRITALVPHIETWRMEDL